MESWTETDRTAWLIGWAVIHAMYGEPGLAVRLLATADPRAMRRMLRRIPGMQPDDEPGPSGAE